MICQVCNGKLKKVNFYSFKCESCDCYFSNLKPSVGQDVSGIENLRRKNFRKLIKKFSKYSFNPEILEIGSGDGKFLESLKHIKGLNLKGVDLQPKPKSISSEIEWIQEDILNISDLPQNNSDPTAVICNLILHHFTDDQLSKLGKLISKANHIIINEPSRRLIPLLMGYLAFPLLGKVTRHDMIISIRAGFRDRELLKFFPSKNCLMIKETLRGGIRCHLS